MPRFHSGAALAAALTLALMPGCGGSTSAYVPNASASRVALDTALSAWQKGGKPDELAKGTPPVHFVDTQWETGQTLEGYQILEADLAGATTEKRYAVVLKLPKPEGEKRVEYIAVGRTPVWIFRDVDYAQQTGMGETPKAKPQRRRAGAEARGPG